jgi:hypothetical protein
MPDLAPLPRLNQRDGHQQEQDPGEDELGAATRGCRWLLVQPPGESEEEADVRQVRVAIGHHRLADGHELEDEGDIDQEERDAEQDAAVLST